LFVVVVQASIEHNRVSLSLKPFSVVDCIEEALDTVSTLACFKEIELLYDIVPLSYFPAATSVVVGDALRVRQVLLALLSNAVKFTTRKDAHVVVRARFGSADATANLDSGLIAVEFSVEDEGIGIKAAEQASLFRAFAQAIAGFKPFA
jgi:signal transduction histidine kinase